MSRVAGAALLKALHCAGLGSAQNKWPHDVVCSSRKIAGILCEMEAETDVIHAVVVGIGVNVQHDEVPR